MGMNPLARARGCEGAEREQEMREEEESEVAVASKMQDLLRSAIQYISSIFINEIITKGLIYGVVFIEDGGYSYLLPQMTKMYSYECMNIFQQISITENHAAPSMARRACRRRRRPPRPRRLQLLLHEVLPQPLPLEGTGASARQQVRHDPRDARDRGADKNQGRSRCRGRHDDNAGGIGGDGRLRRRASVSEYKGEGVRCFGRTALLR